MDAGHAAGNQTLAKLRDDIKARVNKALEKAAHDPKERQEVLSVYFSDFIIQ